MSGAVRVLLDMSRLPPQMPVCMAYSEAAVAVGELLLETVERAVPGASRRQYRPMLEAALAAARRKRAAGDGAPVEDLDPEDVAGPRS